MCLPTDFTGSQMTFEDITEPFVLVVSLPLSRNILIDIPSIESLCAKDAVKRVLRMLHMLSRRIAYPVHRCMSFCTCLLAGLNKSRAALHRQVWYCGRKRGVEGKAGETFTLHFTHNSCDTSTVPALNFLITKYIFRQSIWSNYCYQRYDCNFAMELYLKHLEG